jgi:tripartite-type tricarboxylate transporter receptor subunit TctC
MRKNFKDFFLFVLGCCLGANLIALPVVALGQTSAAGLASAGTGSTQTTSDVSSWPTKPLRFIVPYPPGGPLDAMARLLAEKVKDQLGQTVVVENKPGAGGNLGADLVAKALPDGYTLVMGAVATHAINPWLYASIPYDAVKDFAPITLVASVPNVLIVNKAFSEQNKITSVNDLLRYARANPGKLNFGSGGGGSAGHLAGELLKARTQIDVVHIPYQGASPAQLALLSGQSDFMFDNLAAAMGLIRDSKVLALAVTTTGRSPVLPDLPTMEQAGVSPFDIGTWFGIFTRAGTPTPVLDKLYAVYSSALNDPAVQERLKTMGSNASPLTAAEFAAMVQSEKEKYREIVKRSGAQAN